MMLIGEGEGQKNLGQGYEQNNAVFCLNVEWPYIMKNGENGFMYLTKNIQDKLGWLGIKIYLKSIGESL